MFACLWFQSLRPVWLFCLLLIFPSLAHANRPLSSANCEVRNEIRENLTNLFHAPDRPIYENRQVKGLRVAGSTVIRVFDDGQLIHTFQAWTRNDLVSFLQQAVSKKIFPDKLKFDIKGDQDIVISYQEKGQQGQIVLSWEQGREIGLQIMMHWFSMAEWVIKRIHGKEEENGLPNNFVYQRAESRTSWTELLDLPEGISLWPEEGGSSVEPDSRVMESIHFEFQKVKNSNGFLVGVVIVYMQFPDEGLGFNEPAYNVTELVERLNAAKDLAYLPSAFNFVTMGDSIGITYRATRLNILWTEAEKIEEKMNQLLENWHAAKRPLISGKVKLVHSNGNKPKILEILERKKIAAAEEALERAETRHGALNLEIPVLTRTEQIEIAGGIVKPGIDAVILAPSFKLEEMEWIPMVISAGLPVVVISSNQRAMSAIQKLQIQNPEHQILVAPTPKDALELAKTTKNIHGQAATRIQAVISKETPDWIAEKMWQLLGDNVVIGLPSMFRRALENPSVWMLVQSFVAAYKQTAQAA